MSAQEYNRLQLAVIQKLMASGKWPLFNDVTTEAGVSEVKAWQAMHGLTVDGKVGPRTVASFSDVPKPASENPGLQRARSAINKGIRYGLGFGGLHPEDPLPARMAWKAVKNKLGIPIPTKALWCDCSGFIAWVIGRSRKPSPDWKWWLSTNSIWSDAQGKQVIFEKVEDPIPGDLIVYPDYYTYDRGEKEHHEGHVAVLVDLDSQTVIDCGSSSGGISERRLPAMFQRSQTIFCRVKV